MPRPKVSDWKSKEELLNAGVKGWNVLQRFPKLMEANFDWAREFEFGFFSEDDVPEAGTIGWAHLRTDHFDVDDFNKQVGTRFGLTDSGGVVKWRHNFIMMMPKDFRKRQVAKRNEAHEKAVADTLRDTAYAHPADPRFQEMKEASESLSEAEFHRVIAISEEDRGSKDETTPVKRGPGRPPKNKG